MMNTFDKETYAEIEEIVYSALQYTTKKEIQGYIDRLEFIAGGQNSRVRNKISDICGMLNYCCNRAMYAQRQKYRDFVVSDLSILKGMIVAEDGDDQ